MSKKLLIAVLTLGLLFCLSGTVLSDDGGIKAPAERIMTINPDAARFNDLTEVQRPADAFEKPIGAPIALPSPVTLYPPPYFCEFLEYQGPAAYVWMFPNVNGPYNIHPVAMRMTPAEGYDCELANVWFLAYPGATIGVPDVDVTIWSDDGTGWPNANLGTVTWSFPGDTLPTDMGWVSIDVSSLGLSFHDGAEFHIGITTNQASATAGDTLAMLSDDGTYGQGRAHIGFNDAGDNSLGWGSYTGDYNFIVAAEVCCTEIPFSECYTNNYSVGAAYFWNQPDSYGDDYFNMRMSVSGPETISAVGVATYAPSVVGTADLDVFIWGSDAGFPDLSDVWYQTTIAFGDMVYFPDYNHVDVYAENLIPRSDFHIGWSTNEVSDPTGVHGGMSDDGSEGTMRSSELLSSSSWATMLGDWGVDVNFLIYADMCPDKFSFCKTEADYCGVALFWRLPDRYGAVGNYQMVSPTGLGCRLEKIRIALYDNGEPSIYTENAEVQVWDNSGTDGLPGNLLYSLTILPADYVLFPGMLEVDVATEGIRFDSDVWIGIESLTSDTLLGIRTLSDHYSDGCGARRSAERLGDASFIYFVDDWGVDVNFVIEADVCCELPPEDPCINPTGWPIAAHDYRRTNRSKYSDGDAKCKQDMLWMHNDPDGFGFNRPVIADGKVIAAYGSKLQAFDINSGVLAWTISGLPTINAGFRNSVAVDDGKVYFGGGNARSFNCADVTTGALIWSRNIVSADAFVGNTSYAIPVIMDGAVYFTTEIASPASAELVALDAATGANLAGWATNPVMLDGGAGQTLAADPVISVLYVATDGNGNTSGYGSIYAIDGATGATIWQLTDTELSPYAYPVDEIGETATSEVTEDFAGPIAVDLDGDLYIQSAFDPNTEINGPPDGVHYRIDNAGNVVWGVRGGSNFFSGAVLDVNMVYFVGVSNWLNTDEPLVAHDKISGSVVWTAADQELLPLEWSESLIEGILECTLIEDDIMYQGSSNEPIFFAINGDNGTLEFEYHFEVTGAVFGTGLAMDEDHMVFTNRQGDIYVMTEGVVDRPRLRILTTYEYADVPFLSPNGYIVTFDDVFMNNGCANLTGNLTADEAAPAAFVTTVDPDRITRMMDIADNMVDYSYAEFVASMSKKDVATPSMSRELISDFNYSPYSKDNYSNNAAYALPAWLNNITVATAAFDLAPGAAHSISYDVNGPLVTRGEHPCFVTINLTNEQYYLNNTSLNPTVELGIVGGCTASTDTLYWGTTAQNYSVVYNTGQIAGDARVDGFMISIDGEEDYFCYFAGYLYFAQSDHKVAWSGFTDNNTWETLLADPNCAGQCETYFQRGIVLGQYTTDGTNYTDIFGDAGTYTFVDSCINYDCLSTGWNWSNLDCPFDNSYTMGISVKCTEYGAFDVPELNNFKICKLEITNRNPVAITEPIYYSMWVDHDLGVSYDDGYDWGQFYFLEDYDVAWGGACGGGFETATNVWGAGTIGHDMRGVRTLRADMSDGDLKHDSVYYWMANELGSTYQPDLGPACFDPASNSAVGDRQALYSFSGFTFDADETITTGYYIFGYSAVAGGLDTHDSAAVAQTAMNAQQFAGFGRGDMNADGVVNLADVVYLHNYVGGTALGPKFMHLADVDASGAVDLGDVLYLANFCFCSGAAPVGEWVLPDICPAP
ncbi:MAG: PQQ-binding-like beta-propeller repeat protein [candidate division Zixibacteria bacterium]|nr:PQQ-binding-like beta-propeller repeat protein [candidate division Zixibacteria bacterium]